MTKQQKEKLVLAIVKANPDVLIGLRSEIMADVKLDADDIISVNLNLRPPKSPEEAAERKRLASYHCKFAQFRFDCRSARVQALYNIAASQVNPEITTALSTDELINWYWIPIGFTSTTFLKCFKRRTRFDSYIACLYKNFLIVDVNDAKEAELQLVLMGRFLK